MRLWSDYVLAGTIEEALAALADASVTACPIAGGTDLLLELGQGRHEPIHTLVDVTRIPELRRLEIRGEELFIGAAVPVREIASSPLVVGNAAATAQACALIGGPQVRNTATLGGNVAHALPAADGMISLVALGAVAEIASEGNVRRAPILELFAGPGRSSLRPGLDLLVGFYLPLRREGESSAFARIMRPQGVALPILNAAVWISRKESSIRDIRVVVGPSGPVPVRAGRVEEYIRGGEFGDELFREIREAIPDSFRFRSSPQRAGAAYRYDLCGVLLEEVVRAAWLEAGRDAA